METSIIVRLEYKARKGKGMNISKNKVVTIEYSLRDEAGELLDSSEGGEPLIYLHGNENIIPGLEKFLEGKTAEIPFLAPSRRRKPMASATKASFSRLQGKISAPTSILLPACNLRHTGKTGHR